MSEELTPMNHRELWLQAIATGTVPEWLEPMTHEELWLKAIAQGGGSSGGGVLVVTDTDGTLDKTWQEINDAGFAVVKGMGYIYPVIRCLDTGANYIIGSLYYDGDEFQNIAWRTNAADGYPTRT